MRISNLTLLLISNAFASVGAGVGMIAAPWLILQEQNGLVIFTGLAMILNLALFFFTPFVGPIIDKYSRKKLMIGLRISFVVVLLVLFIEYQYNFFQQSNLIIISYYIIGTFFYAINIPLRTAFVKDLFEKKDLLKVNSILEIENQIAAVVTGGVSVLLIVYFSLELIILANIILYILAIILIKKIKHLPPKTGTQTVSFFVSLTAGIKIARRNGTETAVLMISIIPYIIVILFGVIYPIALINIAQASNETYALIELLFGLGAAFCGLLLLSKFNSKIKLKNMLSLSLFLFSLTTILQCYFPTYWGFIFLATLFGFSNSFVRIARQTYLMENTESSELGRLGALLQSWTMLLRAIFMAIISFAITNFGPQAAINITVFISTAAFLILMTILLAAKPTQMKIWNKGNPNDSYK